MQPLSATQLLDVWERGQGHTAVQRALLLLAAACPDVAPAALAELPLGRRDVLLLTLREWAFGPEMVSCAACPACGERVEAVLSVPQLRALEAEAAVPALAGGDVPAGSHCAHVDGWEVWFRLPNSLDIAALEGAGSVEAARERLLRRCVLAARAEQGEAGEFLPEVVATAVAVRMAEADPAAEISLDFTCPGCSHAWPVQLDVLAYFWAEIHAWARRALREVHLLASAYGWSEEAILRLTPRRRRLYLEMVAG